MTCPKIGIEQNKKLTSLKKEIFRKSIHICTIFVPVFAHFFKIPVLLLLTFAVIFYFISEILRQKGIIIPLISLVTVTASRKRDENKIVLGPITLVLGIVFSLLLWQEPYSTAGIFALALGDGFASLAGKTFGTIQIPFSGGKTADGSLTCFFAIFVSSFLVLKNAGLSLILGIVGVVIEVLPLKDFDNLLIPIVIGGIAQYLSMI